MRRGVTLAWPPVIRRLAALGRHAWQVDVDRETAELAPSGRHLSTHRLDEALDDGQADPGPAP